MKAAKSRRIVSEVKQTPSVRQVIKRNILVKQNPYTRQWYCMEEESALDYMKLRYSKVEFLSKPLAVQALEENKVIFDRWEVF